MRTDRRTQGDAGAGAGTLQAIKHLLSLVCVCVCVCVFNSITEPCLKSVLVTHLHAFVCLFVCVLCVRAHACVCVCVCDFV